MRPGEEIRWDRDEPFFKSQERVAVPLLRRALSVEAVPEEEAVSAAQLEALTQFLALPDSDLARLTHPLALDCYFTGVLFASQGLDASVVELPRREDVWRHVRFTSLMLPRHGATRDRYVFLLGECEWEEEHGVELLFKNGKIFKLDRQQGLFLNEEWDLLYIDE